MTAGSPDDSEAALNADEPGFTDESYNARYDRKPTRVPVSASADRTGAPRANLHVEPARPRSRNSYMRARARRLSASPPT
jgi:hypothetical protein